MDAITKTTLGETLFPLVKSEVKALTPELAREFRAIEATPTERDLKEKRVLFLRDKAISGRLVTFHWATAFVKDIGKTVRINGQHSSAMLCRLADEGVFPEGLKVHLDTFEVPDLQRAALLFQQIDSKDSVRKADDIAGSHQGAHEVLRGLNRLAVKKACDGVAWYRREILKGYVPGKDDIYFQLMAEEGLHPFLKFISDVLTNSMAKELLDPGVLGSMYATFTLNEAEAGKFWNEVAADEVYAADDNPTKVLDDWLKIGVEQRAVHKAQKIGSGQYYQGCGNCWNAFREGKVIKDVRYDARKGWVKLVR